jgi:hypothetical protein
LLPALLAPVKGGMIYCPTSAAFSRHPQPLAVFFMLEIRRSKIKKRVKQNYAVVFSDA